MSEKIKQQHLSRKAILYIRQSSQYQVVNNLESQKLQYAMEARVWPATIRFSGNRRSGVGLGDGARRGDQPRMSLLIQSIIKHKMGLLNLAEGLHNVSQACRVMGVSRGTFYRVKEAKENGGMDALLHKDRRRPNPKNRIDSSIENPAAGQVRVSNEFRKKGIFVSPTGVRSVWLRHGLQTFRLRLGALEKKVAEEGILLTEAQIAALERKREEQQESGEIETAHPGYLGSRDTFYVANMKGVGRIYHQTFVDTYAKVAFAKLYTTKTPITAADMLNDRSSASVLS